MNRAPLATWIWMSVLLLGAVGLTLAGFFALLIPDYRGLTFYSVVITSCLAELVLFSYLGYFLTVPHTVKRPSPAVRMRILVLVVIWFFIILASGSVAVHPSQIDTLYSDKIVLFQAILTFLLLLGCYFFHRQDVLLQLRDDAPQRERVHLQSYAGGVDTLLDSLRWIAEQRPHGAVELERLAKRLDGLKTQLLCVSPVAQREPGRLVQPFSIPDIEEQLAGLQEGVTRLATADDKQFAAQLLAVRQGVDGLSALLRRREDVITF